MIVVTHLHPYTLTVSNILHTMWHLLAHYLITTAKVQLQKSAQNWIAVFHLVVALQYVVASNFVVPLTVVESCG